MRVRDDIGLRRVDAGALLQLNDAGRLQEEQSAAAVRGVIRDRDRSAVLDVLQILALAGIKTDRFDMDRGQGEEVSLMLLLEVIEIRLMLEEVRVNRLVFQSRVRLDIIVELDNLQRDAFFLEVLRGNLQKISVRDRSRADLDGDIAGSSARTRRSGGGSRRGGFFLTAGSQDGSGSSAGGKSQELTTLYYLSP